MSFETEYSALPRSCADGCTNGAERFLFGENPRAGSAKNASTAPFTGENDLVQTGNRTHQTGNTRGGSNFLC